MFKMQRPGRARDDSGEAGEGRGSGSQTSSLSGRGRCCCTDEDAGDVVAAGAGPREGGGGVSGGHGGTSQTPSHHAHHAAHHHAAAGHGKKKRPRQPRKPLLRFEHCPVYLQVPSLPISPLPFAFLTRAGADMMPSSEAAASPCGGAQENRKMLPRFKRLRPATFPPPAHSLPCHRGLSPAMPCSCAAGAGLFCNCAPSGWRRARSPPASSLSPRNLPFPPCLVPPCGPPSLPMSSPSPSLPPLRPPLDSLKTPSFSFPSHSS